MCVRVSCVRVWIVVFVYRVVRCVCVCVVCVVSVCVCEVDVC